METCTFEGKVLTIETYRIKGNFISAKSGRYHCSGREDCPYCIASTREHDAHYYSVDHLPMGGFIDDQGRKFGPAVEWRFNDSPSFGWWERTWRWYQVPRFASYLSERWGEWAQYCRSQAGFYRNFPRKRRRLLETAAHQNQVRQIPRMLLMRVDGGKPCYAPVEGELHEMLVEAAM